MNYELKSIINQQSQKMKSLQDSNVQLQSSLQKDQIDVLDAGDAAFDREKAQALCLYPDIDLSEIDFIKVVVNGHLMDMEEFGPSPTNDPIQEDCTTVSNPEARGEDKDKEQISAIHFVMFSGILVFPFLFCIWVLL